MKILGISGGYRQGYQDVAACLVENGIVVAAIEEERLNRIKFSPGKLPFLSINEILKIAKIQFSEIDLIAFHGITWGEEFQDKLEDYFIQNFGSCPKIKRYHHHDCHAASSFFQSNFEQATVITFDNSGDGISLQIMKGESGKLTLLERLERPKSLGLFYQLITQYCGFTKDSEEYKVMGLSSYGNPNAYDFSFLIDFKEGELNIHENYFNLPSKGSPSLHKDEVVFTTEFTRRMGRNRRVPTEKLTEFFMDVSASGQKHFEDLLVKIVTHYLNLTGLKKVCFAGGGALNCVANQKIMNLNKVEELFVSSYSNDAGIAIGAAWLACLDYEIIPKSNKSSYLGTEFNNDKILEILEKCKIKYTYILDICEDAALEIKKNNIIGWFQGKMEFGPRALGNRSILANATNADMQKIVNEKIKFRESFRPFCPSVLEEDAPIYFEGKQMNSPLMTITYNVKKEVLNLIPSVVHVDKTARIQTVNEQQNKLFFKLLTQIKHKTGHGVVMNTSFNLSHEPIVFSPRDALASFFSSGLDVLYLGNYKITKD